VLRRRRGVPARARHNLGPGLRPTAAAPGSRHAGGDRLRSRRPVALRVDEGPRADHRRGCAAGESSQRLVVHR
jgi:hypothetical protein